MSKNTSRNVDPNTDCVAILTATDVVERKTISHILQTTDLLL